MKSTSSRCLMHLGIGFLVLRLVASTSAQEPKPTPCCFEHEGYQGVCTVFPAKDETCESILEYLNAPNTVGKTYCGSSRLRGGWRSVPCTQPGAHPSAVTPGSR